MLAALFVRNVNASLHLLVAFSNSSTVALFPVEEKK